MEEKLNKMKWLHEQGFEPDMWRGTVEGGYIMLCSDGFRHNQNAYFTESKLWSLLPKAIMYSPKEDAYSYLRISTSMTLSYGREPTFYTIPDLHTALLDCVIWCVENKYLKAEGE